MTCPSTFLKYPFATLAQTPAVYILMYCNASSTTFPAVRCSNSGKRYWDCKLPCIEAQIELSSTFVYDQKMSTSGSSARNSHLSQGGRMKMMPMSSGSSTCGCSAITPIFFSRIVRSEALVYNLYFFQNSRFMEIIRT